jgi:hypothetical protein
MKKLFNEGNQIHNFMYSSGSGSVINYGSGSDFLTSYGSGSTSQKVTVPTVPVPQHCKKPHKNQYNTENSFGPLGSILLPVFANPGKIGQCFSVPDP